MLLDSLELWHRLTPDTGVVFDLDNFKENLRRVILCLVSKPATEVLSVETTDGPADVGGGWTALAGTTLEYIVDDKTYSLTFSAVTFTAAEAAAEINTITPRAAREVGTFGSERSRVALGSSLAGGTDSKIRVTGGSANAVLGFATTESVGSGLADSMVGWVDEAQPTIAFSQSSRINLDILSARGLGRENIRIVNDGLGGFTRTMVSPHRVVVSVQCEDVKHSAALTLALKIQNSLKKRKVIEAFKAACITFNSASDATKLPERVIDQRTYAWYNIDLTVSYMNQTLDDTVDAGDYIASVEITSPFLPPPPNPLTVP